MIVKTPRGQYQVRSQKGRSMGIYPTRQAAEERLKQIEMYKHMQGPKPKGTRRRGRPKKTQA